MSVLNSVGAVLKGKGASPGATTYWPVIIYATLVATAFLTLVPIIWMVLTAFKSAPEVAARPPTWWPREWHPENFVAAWNFAPFGRFLMNSLIIAGRSNLQPTSNSALTGFDFTQLLLT